MRAALQGQLINRRTDCTQSTDLAGIYFAVLASYEQQIVDQNQQALQAAVTEYRTAYRAELPKIPAQPQPQTELSKRARSSHPLTQAGTGPASKPMPGT